MSHIEPCPSNASRAPQRRHSCDALELKRLRDNASHLRHDALFNQRRKVEVESALAGIVLKHADVFFPVIHKVAHGIRPLLHACLAAEAAARSAGQRGTDAQIFCDYLRHDASLRAMHAAAPDPTDNFDAWLQASLGATGEAGFYTQLFLAQQVVNFFVRPWCAHEPAWKTLTEVPLGFALPGLVAADLDRIRHLAATYKLNPAYFETTPQHPSRSRLRTRVPATRNPAHGAGLFVHPDERRTVASFMPAHPPLPHTGVGLWRVTSESDFGSQARHDLDMPLMAGCSGGTGSMIVAARVLGQLDPEELRMFALACMAHMVLNGFHSAHECATVARVLGVPYTDGDYGSLVPEALRHLPQAKGLQRDLLRLARQYPELHWPPDR